MSNNQKKHKRKQKTQSRKRLRCAICRTNSDKQHVKERTSGRSLCEECYSFSPEWERDLKQEQS